MDEKDWLIIKTLYEKKSISKAAELLYISQPALTYRIQNIEKQFGAQMVSRGKKGVEFTPQGESMVEYAEKMLLELRKTKEMVQNMNDQVRGTLRLGVSSNFARYRLPILLKQFLEIYPEIEIHVKTGWSSEVVNFLYRDEVHIGIVRGENNWHEQIHLLYEEPLCIASTNPIHLQDLPNLPRINYKTDSHLKDSIYKWWQAHYNQPPLITMEVDRIDTCVELVKHGMGYAIIPGIILSDRDSLHTINLHSSDNKPILRKTWMINRDITLELSVVKAFVDFIKKESCHVLGDASEHPIE
ncbi:LysR family transcriptional regulator [Paenibacillus sp. tmac-D7]|uniref:LysR family transcriptional regulator n=1 Tax=Paenibacillus sp. tmac-D7 TaxID=2591462 RepID=UPI0011411C21|nr:LysR family transcriptional regulator [Paenibacillus sp. tmac-D7]